MSSFGRTTMARRKKLLALLDSDDYWRVPDLAEEFGISQITIRRDLTELAREGIIERFHGGARLAKRGAQLVTPAVQRAESELTPAFQAIGQAAAQLVRVGDTVLLSGGRTTLAVFHAIAGMDIRIVTNNAMILGALGDQTKAEVFVLGGEYNPRTRALNGDLTNLTLNEVHGNICFLGANAMSAETGITSSIYAAAVVNRLMANQCRDNAWVVADGSKIGATANFVSLPLTRLKGLITDDLADPRQVALYRQNGLEVVVCELG